MNYSNFSKDDVTFAINRGTGQVVAIEYEGPTVVGYEDWDTWVSSDGKRWAFTTEGDARHTTARDQEYTPYIKAALEPSSERANGSVHLDERTGEVFVLYGGRFYLLTGATNKVRPRRKREAHWIHIGSLNGKGSDFASVYYAKGRNAL